MIIGADIGTTNSGGARFDGKAARMIEQQDGSTILPSVVTIWEGQPIVGREAIELGTRNKNEFTYRHFKRNLAERWHDEEHQGSQTVEGADGMLAFKGPDGASYTPLQLYSCIVYEILTAARNQLGEPPTGLVLCLPADFTEGQRSAAEEAAWIAVDGMAADLTDNEDEAKRIADAFILELMNEPTAAALAYGFDAKKARCIAVYDLGGGTFDISIIRAGNGLTRVLATNGIRDKGGTDFDWRIAQLVLKMWRTENPDQSTDLSASDSAMSLILVEAEEVKKRLSAKTETVFRIDNIDKRADGTDLHMNYTITRAMLEEITADLREQIMAACKVAIEEVRRTDPNFSVRDLHDVLLVGGMTRMPAIQRDVAAFFGKAPKKDESPEQVVAMGAAIRGAIIDGRRPDLSVADITSHTLAIERAGDVAAIIFQKGTSFPTDAKTEVRFTITNETQDQKQLSIRVIQGEAHRASVCEVLARAAIPIEPGAPQSARVPLVARLDVSGRPTVICGDVEVYGGGP